MLGRLFWLEIFFAYAEANWRVARLSSLGLRIVLEHTQIQEKCC